MCNHLVVLQMKEPVLMVSPDANPVIMALFKDVIVEKHSDENAAAAGLQSHQSNFKIQLLS